MTALPADVLMMDVDGVLVRGRPRDGLDLFTDLEADLGLSPDLLKQEFFAPYWEAIVTGREPLAGRLASVLEQIAPVITADMLISYWFENDSWIDPDVLSPLARYRQRGARIYLATNQEHMRASYLMTTLGLGAHVDGMVYSAEIGHRKPSVEFYRMATQRVGVAATRIVLVDDTLANVEAARAYGWHAIRWTGDRGIDEVLAPHFAG